MHASEISARLKQIDPTLATRFDALAAKEYKRKLDPIAKKIAQKVGDEINKAVRGVDTPDMPYKAQYVLEEVIKILEAAV